ncbi:hypothetical protein [Nostoc sp.]|uniref:hypothetical protein n=1 Tax=Nostoc sp. TaxID=1180 RepID=UPI002FF8A83D
MLRLSNARNLFMFLCLFVSYCYDANSSSIAAPIVNQPQFIVNNGCQINYNRQTSELKISSKLAVNAQLSRVRCIIRINTSTQNQFRLVPLAFKGQVKKAPAQVAISSFVIGDQPTRVLYTSPSNASFLNFDLTKQILPTNYTTPTQGKSVIGINLILTTSGGESELTDVRFTLQQK